MATQAQSPTPRWRRPSQITLEIEGLLDRYPMLGEAELARLIESVPHLPARDAVLMSADDRLAKKLEALHREHGDRIEAPIGGLLAFLILPAMVIAAVLWLILGALPPA